MGTDLDFEFGDNETMEYEELIKNTASEPVCRICVDDDDFEDVDVEDI